MSVLGLTYVHHSVCSFALPALLPQLSRDLSLADFQGALLTSGYSAIYAVSLIPAGAGRHSKRGIATWCQCMQCLTSNQPQSVTTPPPFLC